MGNNFPPKNNEKQKVEKTKKYIRNWKKNNKKHKELILMPNFFFHENLLRTMQEICRPKISSVNILFWH